MRMIPFPAGLVAVLSCAPQPTTLCAVLVGPAPGATTRCVTCSLITRGWLMLQPGQRSFHRPSEGVREKGFQTVPKIRSSSQATALQK